MICVSALYPAAGESRFDMTYYMEKHIPLLNRLLTPFGLHKIEVDEGLGGFAPGSAPNYKIICRMYFDSLENFQAGVSAAGGEIFSDVPHYTDIPIELQISNLVY